MDRITLQGIDVYAHHGIHPAERELGQRFVIDCDLWADLGEAAARDSLRLALDYTAVHRRICEVAATDSYHLLEALALAICRTLLREFAVARAAVTVQKPNPPIPNFLGRVAVTVERSREELDAAAEARP